MVWNGTMSATDTGSRFVLRWPHVLRWASEHLPNLKFPKIRVTQNFILFFIQLLGALSVLIGISWYSIPLALIIGGIGAIVAVEMQNREPRTSPEQILHVQNKLKRALAAGEDPFSPPHNVPLTPAWITYAASLRKQR